MAQVGLNCDILSRCNAISVCIAGDFNQELLADAQIEALRAEIAELRGLYPDAKIVFHREVQANRTCAGKLFTHEYLNTRILQKDIPAPDPEDKEKKEKIEAENKRKIAILTEIVALYEQVVALVLGKKK